MNKKLLAIALVPSLLLACCDLLDIFVEELNDMTTDVEQPQNNTQNQQSNNSKPQNNNEQTTNNQQNNNENQGNQTQPDPIEFSVTSAQFTDNDGHLKVNYTCNYGSPFEIEEHTYHHLNITGVLASEVDSTHEGYFTLLSPIIQTNLKFEFYDTDENVYISKRCQNVVLYEENVTPPDTPVTPPGPTIDYPAGYNTLYWSDEFDGNSLDTSKWTYEIGNGEWGWGNGESQYYTDHNDTVADGVLTIKGKKENVVEIVG